MFSVSALCARLCVCSPAHLSHAYAYVSKILEICQSTLAYINITRTPIQPYNHLIYTVCTCCIYTCMSIHCPVAYHLFVLSCSICICLSSPCHYQSIDQYISRDDAQANHPNLYATHNNIATYGSYNNPHIQL